MSLPSRRQLQLDVVIIDAQLTRIFDSFKNNQDVFVQMVCNYADGSQVVVGRTEVCRNGNLHPRWSERFLCGRDSGRGGKTLVFQLHIQHNWRNPVLCGEAEFGLDNLWSRAAAGAQKVPVPLFKKGEQTGILNIQIALQGSSAGNEAVATPKAAAVQVMLPTPAAAGIVQPPYANMAHSYQMTAQQAQVVHQLPRHGDPRKGTPPIQLSYGGVLVDNVNGMVPAPPNSITGAPVAQATERKSNVSAGFSTTVGSSAVQATNIRQPMNQSGYPAQSSTARAMPAAASGSQFLVPRSQQGQVRNVPAAPPPPLPPAPPPPKASGQSLTANAQPPGDVVLPAAAVGGIPNVGAGGFPIPATGMSGQWWNSFIDRG